MKTNFDQYIDAMDLIRVLSVFAYEQGADFGLWLDSDEISEDQYGLIRQVLNEEGLTRHPSRTS